MVRTRSRANSASRSTQQPVAGAATMHSGDGEVFVDVRTSTPPLAGPSSAGASAPSSPPQYGRERPDLAQLAQFGSAPPTAAVPPQPILMTDQQLILLLQSLRAPQGGPPPSTTVSTNLAKCTSRYNGVADVLAFIDSVQIYKDCVGVSDDIALRGLPMLLTDFAATWWQGVKHSVASWQEALTLLRQTFGPRLPPHKIYREIFSREQGKERTDVFVCRVRALIAQLPPNTLTENPVQLDIVYGLLHKRIREKVLRSAVSSFAELLQQARVVEEVLEEGSSPTGNYTATPTHLPPPVTPALTSPTPAEVKPEETSQDKPRLRCSFCKMFGHAKDDCRRLKDKTTSTPVKSEPVITPSELRPSINCFGCGAPGVIRSNCQTCREKNATLPSPTAFQSVSVDGAVLNPRVRPLLKIEVFGSVGTALLDTGAKQSVASVSLTKHLRSNGQVFNSVETELRFADGSQRIQIVETALVNVKVQEREITTLFMVLPGAIDSLLGMNFIKDAGMVLDFGNNRFSLHSTGFFELQYQNTNHAVVSAAVGLSEGVLVSPADKGKLAVPLEKKEGIFSVGGGPTPFSMPRIDSAPISTLPYGGTPAKQEIVRVERQQHLTKEAADKARLLRAVHKVGDLVMIESHSLSQSTQGLTSNFVPQWEGPYRVSRIVSLNTYEVVDGENIPHGKYHASLLTPYVGLGGAIISNRKRGRLRKKHECQASSSAFCWLVGGGYSDHCSVPFPAPRARGVPGGYF
ncbi:uncharacterized protein [Maniola hyperantus]|uniref:uncharacterized protein n=1 Tax=Aphantopus hyperantus TaxID=2795564 RepID=UPI0037483250